MQRIMLLVVLVLLAGACNQSTQKEANSHSEKAEKIITATIEELLANPAEFQDKEVAITGIALNKDVVMIDLFSIKGGDIEVANILAEITKNKINIILMSSHRNADDTTDFSIIVKPDNVKVFENFLIDFVNQNRIGNFVINNNVAQVSLIGSGIANNYGVAFQVFDALATNRIKIFLTSTSEIKISAIVPRGRASQALVILHNKFEMNQLERKIIGDNNGKD